MMERKHNVISVIAFFTNSDDECSSIVDSNRSSLLEVFIGKDFLKTYSKFAGEHPCRSVIEMTWVFFVSLLHIFKTPFPKNT